MKRQFWQYACRFSFVFSILFSLISLSSVYAAPCCSAGGAVPTVITGDDRAQIGLSISQSHLIGNVYESESPVFWSSDHRDITRTYSLQGAFLVSDRWQLGAGIPVVWKQTQTQTRSDSAFGIGDIRTSAAYEFLPDFTYSSWRPKGYLFTQVTLPLARSLHESQSVLNTDALGRGFYSFALGALFVKRWTQWDAYWIPEAHFSPPRTFHPSSETLHFNSFWGGSSTLGLGFSPSASPFRMGLKVSPIFQSARTSFRQGQELPPEFFKLTWDTAVEASYLLENSWSVILNYNDQTLLGPAVNTDLSRSITVFLQKKWLR